MRDFKIERFVLNQWYFLTAIFLLLLLITVNRPMFCDEGFWQYIAKAWTENGLSPYLCSVENKTPGIYYLYMLSNLLFGVNYMFVRILGIVSILISTVLVKRLIVRFSNESAGMLGMYVFGLSNTWFVVDGQYPAVTESFMILFVLLALFRLTKMYPKAPKFLDFVLAGFFLGIAVSFKQIAILSSLAFVLFYLFVFWKSAKFIVHLKNIITLIISALFAHFLFVLPVLLSGVSFSVYFNGAWLILLDQGSHQGDIQALYDFLENWFDSKLFIFWLFIPIAFFKREYIKSPYIIGFVIWFFIDFVAVSLPGTFHEHQFKQFLFPVTVLFSVFMESLLDSNLQKPIRKAQFACFLLGVFIMLFPYRNVIINGYLKGFPDTPVQVGEWIKNNTDEDSSVFVFTGGSAGQIMAYSERVCPVANFNLIFVNSKDDYEALNCSLLKNMPDILVLDHTGRNNHLLQYEIVSQYRKIYQINPFDIYLLKTDYSSTSSY